MKIVRIYTGSDNETHFGEAEISWASHADIGALSARYGVKEIMFRETPANYNYDWHNAPERQFVVNLAGGVKITVSDGESREFPAGAVFLVEDTTGPGHLSQAINNEIRQSLFITTDATLE